MAGSNEDRDRSRRPGAEDRGWSNRSRVLGGRTVERLVDAVCGLHHARGYEEHKFLGLASKPMATVSPGLASKWWLHVSRSGPQNRYLRFGDFGLKVTAMVYWCGPKYQVGYGLSVAP
jgi:hypothetical protein